MFKHSEFDFQRFESHTKLFISTWNFQGPNKRSENNSTKLQWLIASRKVNPESLLNDSQRPAMVRKD